MRDYITKKCSCCGFVKPNMRLVMQSDGLDEGEVTLNNFLDLCMDSEDKDIRKMAERLKYKVGAS